MKYTLLITFLTGILFFTSCNTEESLKENIAFTYGYITDFNHKRYGNPSQTRFKYYVGNKSRTLAFYNSMYCYSSNHKKRDILRKIPIIVAYDSTNVEIGRPLITKQAMKNYNYELPDSLKPMYEKYIFRCQ